MPAASLDALNFLLADVRGALGPHLNVFLVTQRGWSQSSVGLVTTLGGRYAAAFLAASAVALIALAVLAAALPETGKDAASAPPDEPSYDDERRLRRVGLSPA